MVYLREERELKEASIADAFKCVSAFYDYLENEEKIASNPVPKFRKRYLRQYKAEEPAKRKFLSVEELALLVRTTMDTRDRAIILLLFKTGVRRHELVELDLSDISLEGLTITLKPTTKRSNRTVFFDYETADALRRWLEARKLKRGHEGPACS
jgi:integrase/recombinase XerD